MRFHPASSEWGAGGACACAVRVWIGSGQWLENIRRRGRGKFPQICDRDRVCKCGPTVGRQRVVQLHTPRSPREAAEPCQQRPRT